MGKGKRIDGMRLQARYSSTTMEEIYCILLIVFTCLVHCPLIHEWPFALFCFWVSFFPISVYSTYE